MIQGGGKREGEQVRGGARGQLMWPWRQGKSFESYSLCDEEPWGVEGGIR